MKEAAHIQIPDLLHKTRSGPNNSIVQRVHERGDKVVVNGAKQSLLSILRKHVCLCTKHTLQKLTTKFLSTNKVAASYDILVWMFIFIRINCDPLLYSQIIREYLMKMHKKKDEDENHQSQKYIDSKKKTIQKFIQSAEELDADYLNQDSIAKSVGALYSKGKSRQSAIEKIKVYLNKINFDDCLKFQESSCSFKLREETQIDDVIPEQTNQTPMRVQSSIFYEYNENSQADEKIYNLCPLQQEQTEVVSQKVQENQENKSYRVIPNRPSYDLFDELIQEESSNSFLADY